MSLRDTSPPPPLRPPSHLDAVTAPSHKHRQLYLEHVRVSEKVRAAKLRAMSHATLHTAPPITRACLQNVRQAR